MEAVRLEEFDIDPQELDDGFGHIDHMYSGRLSSYYYRRFDQVLNTVKLSPSDRVLIVGGGTGIFALSLIQWVKNIHFTDISREDPLFSTPRALLEHTQLEESSVQFAVADATNLPYSSDSFDVVFALDVLEHIPNERAAIEELARVTRLKGHVVVSAPIEVGPPLAVREAYRFLDGRRNQTESLFELCQSILGSPPLETNQHHRGYDYRQTIGHLDDIFGDVSVDYCPYPLLKWLNPTAIIWGQLDG